MAFGTKREAAVESSRCDAALRMGGTSNKNSELNEESQVFIKVQHTGRRKSSN